MMGMCDVGRTGGSIALIMGVLAGPFNAFSYGSAMTHLEVTEAILGGYGGDEFEEFFEVTSGAIDSMADDFETHFPEMTKKFNPWTHRLMGHSWSLDEDVPKRVLVRLENEYGVSRPKVIRYCKEYQEMIIETAIEMTGLVRDLATAFAALVIDLHQLQDLEPGNRAVKHVGRIEKVSANISRHIGVLLVDRPELAAAFQKKVSAVLNTGRKEGLPEKEMAKKMIDSLMACHLGTAINSCHRETMKLTYNIDRVVAANAKAAAARSKLAIAEQISHFSRKVGNGRAVGDDAIRQSDNNHALRSVWSVGRDDAKQRRRVVIFDYAFCAKLPHYP